MKKIFITGGAGYVGSVLTPFLLSRGYQVTVFDLMLYGSDFFKKDKNLKVIKGDIRDENLLKKSIPGHDSIIHLACISNDPSFELNPKLGESINFKAFEPLVKISRNESVKRFIYASSSSVYGIKKEKDVDELKTLEPLTDYSRFKAECEKILLSYNSNNFTTTIIRPATVCGYGPRQRLDVVVNILTNLAYHNRKILVYGGEQLRPNIHIADMARVYEVLLRADKELVSGEIFNAGYENQKVIAIAEIVKKVIGEDVVIEIEKSNDNRSYHISSKKIKNILNFSTEKTIEDAVIDLKNAFDKRLLKDTLNDKKYFNIKTMNALNLK